MLTSSHTWLAALRRLGISLKLNLLPIALMRPDHERDCS